MLTTPHNAPTSSYVPTDLTAREELGLFLSFL